MHATKIKEKRELCELTKAIIEATEGNIASIEQAMALLADEIKRLKATLKTHRDHDAQR